MTKVFYDDWFSVDEIFFEIDTLETSDDEKEELKRLVDEHIHHVVLDVVLTNLPKDKHERFLKKFYTSPSDAKLLDFLKIEAGDDMESKVRQAAEKVKKSILGEIGRKGK